MIGYVLTAALFYLLSKSKKRPSVGKLPGTRITRGELIRKIRRGEAGDINDGDLFFDGGVLWDDQNIYKSTGEFKEQINETLKTNQNHLRASDVSSRFLSFEEKFGFDNYYPRDNNEAYYFTLLAIANGQKFIWDDQGVKTGLKNYFFGKETPHEKKNFRKIISKDGITIDELNEHFTLDNDFRDGISAAVMAAPSPREAKELLNNLYRSYVNDTIEREIYLTKKHKEEQEAKKKKKEEKAIQQLKEQYELPFIPTTEKDTPF